MTKTNKTALLFGASGLVGSFVLTELLTDKNYQSVIIFVRKSLGIESPKLKEIITDFQNPEFHFNNIQADEIFCCLGTTINKAGSQDAFRKVDFDLPLMIGTLAAQTNISKMLLVSSLGADNKSSNFYLRTKGSLEKELINLLPKAIKIFRPSMLLGPRKESRPAEKAGTVLMKIIDPFLLGRLKKYKAIHASVVAKAMINVANSGEREFIFESDQIQELGK